MWNYSMLNLIVVYWHRKLTFYRDTPINQTKRTIDAETVVPDWLAKNQETRVTKATAPYCAWIG